MTDDSENVIVRLQEKVEQLELIITTLTKFISIEEDKLVIRAEDTISIEASKISVSADVSATLKAGASVELSAGGNTTIKGAMVMIN